MSRRSIHDFDREPKGCMQDEWTNRELVRNALNSIQFKDVRPGSGLTSRQRSHRKRSGGHGASLLRLRIREEKKFRAVTICEKPNVLRETSDHGGDRKGVQNSYPTSSSGRQHRRAAYVAETKSKTKRDRRLHLFGDILSDVRGPGRGSASQRPATWATRSRCSSPPRLAPKYAQWTAHRQSDRDDSVGP